MPADGFVVPKVPGRAEGQCGELCTYRADQEPLLEIRAGGHHESACHHAEEQHLLPT